MPTDRRGSIAVMTAAFLLPVIAIIGLVIDEGFWTIASTRLQIAADAAAMGASLTMSSAAFKAQSATSQATTLQTVAQFEAKAAANKLLGTLQTPFSISYDATHYTTVTVTLTAQPPAYFTPALNIAAPTLSATATVSVPTVQPCVLTLGSSAANYGIKVDNQGSIVASGCPVFSNSPANPSIYLNSGTISGTAIGAVGTVSKSNSGSNSMTPSPGQSNQVAALDPDRNMTPPTPGSCVAQKPYTTNGNWHLSAGTYCNGLTIGGNGSTDTFDPGVYIITNGDLVFNDANITQAANVTFVLGGSNPGSFIWENNSSTVPFTPNATMNGITFWLVCNSNSQAVTIQQGGTFQVSGAIYAPCAAATIRDNGTAVQPPSGAALSFISSSLYVWGSGSLKTSNGGSGSASMAMRLSN